MHQETYKLLAWNDDETLKQWEGYTAATVERDKQRAIRSFHNRHKKTIGPTSAEQLFLSDMLMLRASMIELEAVRMELRTREQCPDYNHRDEYWRRSAIIDHGKIPATNAA